MKKIFKFILNIPKNIAIFFIFIFKFCISPFIPHACKYTPTCSVYASEAFAVVMKKGDKPAYEVSFENPNKINAPTKEGDVIGKALISLKIAQCLFALA